MAYARFEARGRPRPEELAAAADISSARPQRNPSCSPACPARCAAPTTSPWAPAASTTGTSARWSSAVAGGASRGRCARPRRRIHDLQRRRHPDVMRPAASDDRLPDEPMRPPSTWAVRGAARVRPGLPAAASRSRSTARSCRTRDVDDMIPARRGAASATPHASSISGRATCYRPRRAATPPPPATRRARRRDGGSITGLGVRRRPAAWRARNRRGGAVLSWSGATTPTAAGRALRRPPALGATSSWPCSRLWRRGRRRRRSPPPSEPTERPLVTPPDPDGAIVRITENQAGRALAHAPARSSIDYGIVLEGELSARARRRASETRLGPGDRRFVQRGTEHALREPQSGKRCMCLRARGRSFHGRAAGRHRRPAATTAARVLTLSSQARVERRSSAAPWAGSLSPSGTVPGVVSLPRLGAQSASVASLLPDLAVRVFAGTLAEQHASVTSARARAAGTGGSDVDRGVVPRPGSGASSRRSPCPCRRRRERHRSAGLPEGLQTPTDSPGMIATPSSFVGGWPGTSASRTSPRSSLKPPNASPATFMPGQLSMTPFHAASHSCRPAPTPARAPASTLPLPPSTWVTKTLPRPRRGTCCRRR